MNTVTQILLILLTVLYPLYAPGGYSSIERDKYPVFLVAGAALCLFAFAVYVTQKPAGKKIKPLRKKPFPFLPVFTGLFFLCVAVSDLVSGFPEIVWIGWQRYDGLLTWALYLGIFLSAVRLGGAEKPLSAAISAAMLVQAVIVTLQVSGLNPLGLYPEAFRFGGAGGKADASGFAGTLGNVDFTSGYLAICVCFLCGRFVLKRGAERWISFAGMLAGFWALEVIDVSAARIGMAAAAAAGTVLFAGSRVRFSRFSAAAASCLAVSALRLLPFPASGGLPLWLLLTACAAFAAAAAAAPRIPVPSAVRRHPYAFAGSALALAALGAFAAVFFSGFRFGKTGTELYSVLHGQVRNSFGSGRIRIWKRTFWLIREKPVFGGGSDTMGVRYRTLLKAIGKQGSTISDSPHSFLLGQAVNHGIAGLLSYLALLTAVLVPAFRRRTPEKCALLLPVTAYLAFALFSVEEFLVMPVFWCVLGMLAHENRTCGAAAVKNTKKRCA